jgi:hypothetical protein
MSDTVTKQIQSLIDRETLGLNNKNPDLFLDFIHPDMVWPWPPTPGDHDPVHWRFVLGRFNKERWRQYFQAIFDQYDLVHNNRNTVKIEVAPEEDAAFAIWILTLCGVTRTQSKRFSGRAGFVSFTRG